MKLTAAVVCDLCHHHQPSLYCSSDSAFLCSDCDSHVHSANLLVARHIRIPLCKTHSSKSCDNDDAFSTSSSSSSTTCISSTTKSTSTSSKTCSQDWKTRDLLVDWCVRLLGNTSSVTEVSKHAFQTTQLIEMPPYRVGLAASLWLGLLKLYAAKKDKKTLLKNLQQISGVPAKTILVAHSRLAAGKRRRQVQETWDEC